MSEDLEFDIAALEALARSVEEAMDPENPAAYLGTDLVTLAGRIPAEEQVTPGAVVRLALLNDALSVTERALGGDGNITAAELAYARPLAREALKYLARFRRVYRDTVDLERQGVESFLEQHMQDGQKFGGRCKSTAWVGLSVCQRTAAAVGDPIFVEQFRELMVRTLDDLFGAVGSGTEAEKRAIVADIERLAPPPRPERDPRELAYCSPSAPEVFHAVAHGAEVFEQDPFDIESIHADARERFARLVDRAAEAKFGKMLLVKGDAGSGKTHLMRAFRNRVHGEGIGFVAYLQMSTATGNYGRYLLSNLIDSWDRPYWGEAVPDTGLACLSDAVASDLSAAERYRLRDDALSNDELDTLVNASADRLTELEKYGPIHVDVLRMMLYLQQSDPPRRARILKFLRCEELGPYDRTFVGGVSPFAGDEGPTQMLTHLGRLVLATTNGALVLLVDQLEDIFHLDQAAGRFRLAMDALRHVTDSVPSSVVVIACLDDFYTSLRGSLARPMLDRLERDPEPLQLTTSRSADEIEQMVTRRLERLFEAHGVRVRPEEPLYPFRREELAALQNSRSRDVLDFCRKHHEASVSAGRLASPADSIAPGPVVGAAARAEVLKLEQAWNDHRTAATAPPDDDAERMRLLAWAVEIAARELEPAPRLSARAESNYVEVDFGSARVTVGLCDKASQGGHLGKQVDALAARARRLGTIPFVLRSSEYPRPGTSQIAQKLKSVLQEGGRKLTLTDAEWRLIHALQSFRSQASADAFVAWLKEQKPLASITSLRTVMDLAEPPTRAATQPTPARQSRPTHRPIESQRPDRNPPATATFEIGQTHGLTPQPLLADAGTFTGHAAFLGSPRSGKTALALNVLEELLLQGIPALILDRKGALATYAAPEFWDTLATDAPLDERKRKLRDAIDVRVYTPGESRGRPLALPVIPTGLEELATHERGMLARYTASALGSMMGYKKSKSDETRLGILSKAIELVGSARAQKPPGIAELVTLLDEADPDLVTAVGKLDSKHLHALVENLETLRLRYGHVLSDEGERLDVESLLGLGPSARPARTRLSVISTRFIGDAAAEEFWVARLLVELGRFAGRHPSPALRGCVFVDDADVYLPVDTKPATKDPLFDLLKRGRTAGLGVLLATQNPGALDYRSRDNVRTWFVGCVAEKTAVDKMKPLLNDYRVNVAPKLGAAKTGEFWRLMDGEVIEFKAAPALMHTAALTEDAILEAAGQAIAPL